MSHSSHYASFTIHYNGDYSGPYTINNAINYKSGEDKSEDIIKNEYGSPTYICIEYKGGFKGLRRLTQNAVFNKQKQFLISGIEDGGNKKKSFLVDTDDVLNFIIEKERFEMISKIEDMDTMKFFKKYISLGFMNWAIGVNIEK